MFECSPHVYIFCVFFACTFLPLVPFLSLYFLHVFPMVPFGNGLPVALQASGYASSVEMKKISLVMVTLGIKCQMKNPSLISDFKAQTDPKF